MFWAKPNCWLLTRPPPSHSLSCGSCLETTFASWRPRSMATKAQDDHYLSSSSNSCESNPGLSRSTLALKSRIDPVAKLLRARIWPSLPGGLCVRSPCRLPFDMPTATQLSAAVEKWLNRVLCLDATLPRSKISSHGCPDPAQCQLLYINRDTLFSFHPVSEKFLQQMVALYVSSHYKNTPDDLQYVQIPARSPRSSDLQSC